MQISRRHFLARSTLWTASAAGSLSACGRPDAGNPSPVPTPLKSPDDWSAVRELFSLSPDYIHMNALYIASHPKPVRDAIEGYRRDLDADPVHYLMRQNLRRIMDARTAAAGYLEINDPNHIALTDSTTMGLGLIYNGLRLNAGDEVLTSEHEHFVTHESLRLAALHKGITVRRIALYDDIGSASEEQISERLIHAIRPRTRVLALTWVHSGTGLKLPVRRIADALAAINAQREESERILFCLDGVHGFGVEDVSMADLGCDFFIAGCHKWLFGPRGTGLIWGNTDAWKRVQPILPSFQDEGNWNAWLEGEQPDGHASGTGWSPGGFKAFEHQWALTPAFALHQQIGKRRIAVRTHALAEQLKAELSKLPGIRLRTPRSESLSAGIVCLELDGMDPWTAVARLRLRRVIATVTPYSARYVRLAPSIRNTPEEVDAVVREVRALT